MKSVSIETGEGASRVEDSTTVKEIYEKKLT